MTTGPAASASPTLAERWLSARRSGQGMPPYEAVVLGNLGRFDDGVALIATEGGLPARILWCGAQFGQ